MILKRELTNDMDSLTELLPKNKSDDSSIERLSRLSDEQMQPLMSSLLKWLQDMNWPIAIKILPIIAAHQDIAMPHIRSVFRGRDWLWIYWILLYLVPLLRKANVQLIKDELTHLSLLDSVDEDALGIVRLSKEYLALITE